MEAHSILETRGVIIKEEKVKSLESNIVENSLVLENTDAFPGYYGSNLPDPKDPRSLFIICDKKYDELFVARILKKIRPKIQHTFYGTYGDLNFKGKVYPCVRIKNLENFPSLLSIQRALVEEGVGLMKYHSIDENALIRIHKSFLIQPVDVGIFKDMFEENRYYISIPETLEWEKFKKITRLVKSNMENSLFDAALCFLWRIEGLMDMVRIYDKKTTLERIKTIHDKYLYEIKHLSL